MREVLDAATEFLLRYNVQRFWRGVKYALLVASGIFAAIAPSKLVTEEVGSSIALVWAIAMSISSAVCFYSPLTDKWIGEFTGIPLLAAVIALYGFSAIADANDQGLILMAYGLTVLAFACSLSARWLDVLAIKNAHEGEEQRGE